MIHGIRRGVVNKVYTMKITPTVNASLISSELSAMFCPLILDWTFLNTLLKGDSFHENHYDAHGNPHSESRMVSYYLIESFDESYQHKVTLIGRRPWWCSFKIEIIEDQEVQRLYELEIWDSFRIIPNSARDELFHTGGLGHKRRYLARINNLASGT